MLYPLGNGCGDGKHLSPFLAFEDSTLEAIKVYVRYTLQILDQVGAKHKSFQGKCHVCVCMQLVFEANPNNITGMLFFLEQMATGS